MKRAHRPARSLLWRLGMLALAVTFASLVLHMAALAIWFQPMGDRLASQLASRVQLVRQLLQAVPAHRRQATAHELRTDDFQAHHGYPSFSPREPPPPLIGERLSQRLGPDYAVHHRPHDRELWSTDRHVLRVSFDVAGEPWWIELHSPSQMDALLGTGVGWLVFAAAIVALSLLVGMRFIASPIRQVASNLVAQGDTMQPLIAPRHGSAEVLAVVASFNQLVDRVRVADRTRQQLLAGISHDLRTPLARLRLRIETQCEPSVAAGAQSELCAVEHIVSQFLAYAQGESRDEFGKKESLSKVCAQVVASYADQGNDVHLLFAARDTALAALPVRRLLTNLVDNALAYGKPPIHVMWRERCQRERELGVWDGGSGLTQAQFALALEPFRRLSSDADIGHCGLGLAIVAQIARQWGASLQCRHDEAGRFGIVLTWLDPHDEGKTTKPALRSRGS